MNSPSELEKLRLSGGVRSTIIAYGIGATAYFFPNTTAQGAVPMLLSGLGLQALLPAARWLATRYERAEGIEGGLSRGVTIIGELVVDAVTVLLFALGTFRAIAQYASVL